MVGGQKINRPTSTRDLTVENLVENRSMVCKTLWKTGQDLWKIDAPSQRNREGN